MRIVYLRYSWTESFKWYFFEFYFTYQLQLTLGVGPSFTLSIRLPSDYIRVVRVIPTIMISDLTVFNPPLLSYVVCSRTSPVHRNRFLPIGDNNNL